MQIWCFVVVDRWGKESRRRVVAENEQSAWGKTEEWSGRIVDFWIDEVDFCKPDESEPFEV